MDKGKKSIIAGVGILTGIGLYCLLSRDKPTPPTYTCPYCGETFETYEELLAHVEAEHPGMPPLEFGRIWGYIKDTLGARVAGASVYMDGIFETTSDGNGMYTTGYFLWGPHTIKVQADNYEDKTVEITTEQESTELEVLLDAVSVVPTEWTEGVEVVSIKVSPSTAYLGETIEIDVYIQYPYPMELPADIHGSVLVDGILISADFTITFRNPTLRFTYTPTEPGSYTVKAQDKSASFTVIQDIPAKYYSPFGGVRMPACIQVTIPNVEPFDIYQQKFEGGDYLVDGFSDLKVYNVPQLIEGLKNAYPSKWDPSDAVVNNWVAQYRTWRGGWGWPSGAGLVVMATDYDCREYWDTKDELANMIARSLGGGYIPVPDEWRLTYGTTCSNCNGTGQVTDSHGRLSTCHACRGTGKVFMIDLERGRRDWVKDIRYHSICGGGICIPRIYCPYCDARISGPSHVRGRAWDKISFVRHFLTHIETKHPNHPLTEPAWF